MSRQSSIGAILLNRQGGPGASYNRAVGVDLNLVFGRDARLTALLAKTFTPGVRTGNVAGAIDFAYQEDRYNYDLTYLDVGAGFNAEMGYIRRTDARNPRIRAAYTPRPRWPVVRQLTLGGWAEVYATHSGRTESRTADGQFGFTFNDPSTLMFEVVRDYDLLTAPWQLGPAMVPAGGYRWNTARVSYASNLAQRFGGSASFETGSYYGGDKTTWAGAVSVQLSDPLLVEVLYNRNRLALPLVRSYVTDTLSTRVSYSLSPTLFAKAFVQYNSDRKLASLNLMLWSIYRPGSDLYLVYNQGWNTDLPSPHLLQVKNRSPALKLTYWLSR